MGNCDTVCSQVQSGSGLSDCIKCRTQTQENFTVKKENMNMNYIIYLLVFILIICIFIKLV